MASKDKSICKLILEELIKREQKQRDEPHILFRYEFDCNNTTPCEDLMLNDKIAVYTTLDLCYADLILRLFQFIWDKNYRIEDYINMASDDLDDSDYQKYADIEQCKTLDDFKQHISYIINMLITDIPEATTLPFDEYQDYISFDQIPIGTVLNNVGGTELSYDDNNGNTHIVGARRGNGRTFLRNTKNIPTRNVQRKELYTDSLGNIVYNKRCLYSLQELHDHMK